MASEKSLHIVHSPPIYGHSPRDPLSARRSFIANEVRVTTSPRIFIQHPYQSDRGSSISHFKKSTNVDGSYQISQSATVNF